jgi:flagellar protein FlaI
MSFLQIRKKKGIEDILKSIGKEEVDFGERPQYLEEYVKNVESQIGERPQLVEKLSGEAKKLREFNFIYPLGNGIFVHVTSRLKSESGYNRYIVIEPPKPEAKKLSLIEEALAYHISSEFTPQSSEEKKAILLYLLNKILVSRGKANEKEELKLAKKGKVLVKEGEENYIKYHVVREKVGVGILEPFLRDPYLEDVSASGIGNIFVVHKIFGSLESNMGFLGDEELDEFIIKLGEKIGKPISSARPVVDATLPDGRRINIVCGSDVSLRGSTFTLRRVSKSPISVTQLIDWGTFDARIAAYVWMMLREGMSLFVCGETASGKTTSLNAISVFIKPNAKIVSIEDTAEVVFPHPNWTRELTRDTGRPESSVTMFDLLRAALRQRPNYIIVGEIRGAEGNIAFQAMQSVSRDTPIMIKREGENALLTNIGDFVDSYYKEGEEGKKFVKDVSVLSLSPNGKIIFSPIEYLLRHRAEEIYTIILENGSNLKVTGSHSLFVFDPSTVQIVPKPVYKLKEGDYLIKAELKKERPLLKKSGGEIRGDVLVFERDLGVSSKIEELWKESLRVRRMNSIRLSILNKIFERFNIIASEITRFAGENSSELYDVEIPVNGIMKLFLSSLFNKLKGQAREKMKRLFYLLESDLELVMVKEIRKEKYEGFVYDVSVPGTQLFLGGERPFALHNTGHPVMSTFHAADISKLIQRLTNPPISIPKTNMDNLNIAWFQSAVYVKGFPARRVININEIIGYDPASDAIATMPVFTWDPVADRFLFSGKGSSYLLEEKIAVMRGIPRGRINEIYEELETRRRYIQDLVDLKVFDYDRVFKAVIYAENVGIEKALRDLESGRISF